MTWTYTGDPSSSNKDEVRFLAGDTDFDSQLVTDEEIAYAIAQEANNRMAAVRVARAIAAKFSRDVDKAVGDLKISLSQRYKQYVALISTLESEAAIYGAVPFAGGISVSQKDTLEDDSDRVQPSFKRGMHDNPNANTDNDNDLDDSC